MQKATWAAAFWRVRRDFRAALWANSGCADHWGRVAHALPLLLLRKILSEVMPGLRQFNGEADPRERQSRPHIRVRGAALQLIGMLLCWTVVGAIVGIPLIIVGR